VVVDELASLTAYAEWARQGSAGGGATGRTSRPGCAPLGDRRRHRGDGGRYRPGVHVDDDQVVIDLTDESRLLEGQGP